MNIADLRTTSIGCAPQGKHCRRPAPPASSRTRRQHHGLIALLAVSAPAKTPALPKRLASTPKPILMDDPGESRRYRLVRTPYLAWERTRADRPEEFADLAAVVRRALDLGIGR